MSAIQKAIELLSGECCSDYAHEVAAELEALLKQEPVGMYRGRESEYGYDVIDLDAKIEEMTYLYTDPRPPCDLKALAEEVKESVIKAWGDADECNEHLAMQSVDLDAIIAKHEK